MPHIKVLGSENGEMEETALFEQVLLDENLSWKAKGLFGFLYYNTEETIPIELIMEAATDGQDSFRTALSQLIRGEYLYRYNAIPLNKGKNPPPETYYVLTSTRKSAIDYMKTVSRKAIDLDGGKQNGRFTK